jgi:hypothetical protein
MYNSVTSKSIESGQKEKGTASGNLGGGKKVMFAMKRSRMDKRKGEFSASEIREPI